MNNRQEFMMRHWIAAVLIGLAASATADDAASWIAQIRNVGPKGEGHAQAAEAARQLSDGETSSLIPLLQAMKGAEPVAANWLSGVFESLAQKASRETTGLPAKPLIEFFHDRSQEPRARRLAFEWIAKADPEFAATTIPKSLDDPSSEMRRDAVADHMKTARTLLDQGDKEAATREYQLALSGAGDEDQVQELARQLKEMGHEVDLIQHRGFLMSWQLVGPFDNTGAKGFDVAYPPELGVKLDETYEGKPDEEGKPRQVAWSPFVSEKPDGMFDIAKLVAPYKGAIMYATTEFESDSAQPVEFRFGTPNGWKLWLNGKLLLGHEEYHRGMFFDQYQVRGELRPGANTILLKVCQDEQTEDWAQEWVFQFRTCDLTGRALLPSSRKTAAQEAPKSSGD
jgi:hypothetical protein